jgi:hypothetical protein
MHADAEGRTNGWTAQSLASGVRGSRIDGRAVSATRHDAVLQLGVCLKLSEEKPAADHEPEEEGYRQHPERGSLLGRRCRRIVLGRCDRMPFAVLTRGAAELVGDSAGHDKRMALDGRLASVGAECLFCYVPLLGRRRAG